MSSGKIHKDVFTHDGHVSRINRDSIIVALEPNLECESCHARGACGVKGSNTKEIEVFHTNSPLDVNDPVKVYLKKTTGLKAVFWAYLFPFVLMFFTLILASAFLKEWMAGLLSLFVLLPYYFTLYFFKDKLKTSFRISVMKI
jgi:sigma-E factor negative regulatory protein RseC